MKRQKYRLNIRNFSITLIGLLSVAIFVILVTGSIDGKAADAIINTDTEPATAAPAPTPGEDPLDPQKDPLVLLDAGHGGFDPGTIGVTDIHEAVLNLQITKRLKTVLEQNGLRVVMTREDENALAGTKDEDMETRSRMIRRSGADIVVSIHMNWYKNPEISGPTVLYMPGSVQGERLAESVRDTMNTELNTDGVARSEDFFVLRYGEQPSIMVKCGYISNTEEESKLKQSDYQQRVAEAICEGIQNYMKQSGNE
jgi:N-acetylmuramoyl-L-alanine amidase